MKNTVTTLLCLLTMAFLLLFFVQERTSVFKLKPLNGVYVDVPTPEFTMKSFSSGTYQANLEKHLRYHFGFREVLIRLYNQYAWDFFHKTTNQTIKLGLEDWIYGKREYDNYFVSYMYNITLDRSVMKAKFDREAARLYKVQRILDEYDVFLFMTLLPGKEFVYPEYLPEYKGTLKEPFHAIEYYPEVFDSLGVRYIDVLQIFKDKKAEVDYPLYPKTGGHWSLVASAMAFDTIMRYVEHESGMNLRNIQIGDVHPGETVTPDNDLENLLNLFRPIQPNQNYYADTQVILDSTASKPEFILIGDSYFWNWTKSVPLGSIFSQYYYWYYNSTVHFNPRGTHTSELDILKEILNVKIIDLSYSPVQLYVFSNGFLPKALLYLTHEDAEIEAKIEEIASTLDKPEEEKRKSAMDLLFATPEDYFPDLAADGVPSTRNSRIGEIRNH